MERIFTATDDGYYFVPKTAAGDHVIPTQNYPKKPTDERCTICDQYENSHRHSIGWKHRHDFSPPPAKEKQPYLSGHNMPHEAMGPTVKSSPGNHHDEIEGNPLLERRVGNDDSTCEGCGAEMNTIERLCPSCSETSKEAAVGAQTAGVCQPMHDDSGAATGLRRRPDYGESDSITTRLNNANSKGASAQYVIALAAKSRKAPKTATMYVTSIEWDGLKVASFKFGSDASKAVRLPNLTARAVSQQLFAPPFEVKARPVPTASLQSK
jgi:hypothetical protein